MKKPDYVLIFMTTHGSESSMSRWISWTYKYGGATRMLLLQYPEFCHNQYSYRDSFDNKYIRRMLHISIEYQLKPIKCLKRVFQFMLGFMEPIFFNGFLLFLKRRG